MPVRSLRSSVLKWPGAAEVEAALRRWAAGLELPGLVALGYFGSYARGEAGVGSDLDLVLVVTGSEKPAPLRAARLPLETLPVPADALVLTREEWTALRERDDRFARTLRRETRWIVGPP